MGAASAVDLSPHRAFVASLLSERGSATIPDNFAPTAPAHNPQLPRGGGAPFPQSHRNPQTVQFLDMLGLEFRLDGNPHLERARTQQRQKEAGPFVLPSTSGPTRNEEEIDIGDDDEEDAAEEHGGDERKPCVNPEEIPLSDGEHDS